MRNTVFMAKLAVTPIIISALINSPERKRERINRHPKEDEITAAEEEEVLQQRRWRQELKLMDSTWC